MDDRFETFSLAISRLNKFVQKIKAMEMTEFGLKGSHAMCIYYLGKYPEGLTVSELAAHCGEDKAAISRSIPALVNLGFICTKSGKAKREYREKLILTEKGNVTVERIRARINLALDIGGAGMTDEQREIFYDSLKLISDNLMNSDEYK